MLLGQDVPICWNTAYIILGQKNVPCSYASMRKFLMLKQLAAECLCKPVSCVIGVVRLW